jgi:hypothetical protein
MHGLNEYHLEEAGGLLAATEFRIEAGVVTLSADVIEAIKEAQRRQDLRIVEDDDETA